MYNEEIKTRYINERENNVVLPLHALQLDFKKTEPFEEAAEKDVYDFTTHEIIGMYKTWNIKNIDTLYVINSRLKQYVQWALVQNLVFDNQNHFLEIDREMIMKCVNQIAQDLRIITRPQIIAWCARLPNACDKWSLLGTFEGLEGKWFEDLWNTSLEDIDRDKRLIRLNNRIIPISLDLIEYAEESNRTLEYHPMTDGRGRVVNLIENGKIIKDKPNAKNSDAFHKGRSAYVAIKKVCIYLGIDKWTNAKTLHESGMVNFIRNRCQELQISAYDYLWSDYIEEVNGQYDRKVIRSSFYTKYKNYLDT